MTNPNEESWLIALAGDVCEGRPVDWSTVHGQASDPGSEVVLRGLERLARVVDAHRSEPDPPAGAAVPPSSHQQLWRHLILLEVVGTGAFGTVYRAWDPQLEREVALKRRESPSARALWTEAQHLARIHHPNVVTVYGAEGDGGDAGIWMEFIEGQTLSAIVRERGPMSAREVAGIGIDVCRALSALHSAGLLHRDIKAQNVMREVGGRIVLMDFSGAGAMQSHSSGAELSGTPLYMAPELFEGKPASAATDSYSLGVLLFYLFSGRLPIEAASVEEVRAALKHGRRMRLRDLRPDLPDTVVQVVERATHVDPAARYQSAGDLEHALAGLLGPSIATLPSPAIPAHTEHHGTRSGAFIWVVAAAAVVIGALAASAVLRPEASKLPAPPVRFTIGPPYNSTSWPRLSPNGRLVVFGAPFEDRAVFWLRAIDEAEGRPIANATATETPFWSPDSRQLAFFSDEKLKIVDLDSGRIETVTEVVHPRGGDWSASGAIVFATDTGIERIARDGTGRQHVTTIDSSVGEYRHGWPEFLPDGRRFLYVIRSRTEERNGVYLGSLDSGVRKRIMPAYSRVKYVSTGHLLFVRNGTLLTQRFDESSAELRGEPTVLAGPVKYHVADDAAFDVADGGVLIYRFNESPASTRVSVVDRRGRELRVMAPAGFFGEPRLSPDGTRIAVERSAPDFSTPDIWMFDLERHSTLQLTRGPAPDLHPVWSPDGQSVIFSSRRGANYDVYRKVVGDLQDRDEVVWASEDNKRVEDWSRDGRLLAVSVPRKGLFTYEMGTRKASLIRTTAGSDNGMQAEFSPDATLIAYASDESGRPEVYVQPVTPTTVRWRVSKDGGAEPHWRGDGRELTFVSPDGWMTSIDIVPGPRLTWSDPRQLFHVTLPKLFSGSNVSVGRQTDRMVLNSLVVPATIPPIQVVLNHPLLVKP